MVPPPPTIKSNPSVIRVKKRPASNSIGIQNGGRSNKIRRVGGVKIKQEGTSLIRPMRVGSSNSSSGSSGKPNGNDNSNNSTNKSNNSNNERKALKDKFVNLFRLSENSNGISNSALKEKLGPGEYMRLVPIINELTKCGKLVMNKLGIELFYTLMNDDVIAKFVGLDDTAKLAYQVIERAGNMGIWTKEIRLSTNLQQQVLNKIFKALEARKLIKPVKSVNAKNRKLYMLYHLTPSKELTGGVWYSNLEFDHEFISELRTFVVHCIKRLHKGTGVTLAEIREKMQQANVSRVQLSLDEIDQIVQTLIYDYHIEVKDYNDRGEAIHIISRRVTNMCQFKHWNMILHPDFQYCTILFDDDITLAPHEHHYHTE